MAADDHVDKFIGKLRLSLEEVTRPLLESEAPPSMFRRHYNEVLMTALATGELSDYHDNWFIDEETGLLAVKLCLQVPRYRGLIIP